MVHVSYTHVILFSWYDVVLRDIQFVLASLNKVLMMHSKRMARMLYKISEVNLKELTFLYLDFRTTKESLFFYTDLIFFPLK